MCGQDDACMDFGFWEQEGICFTTMAPVDTTIVCLKFRPKLDGILGRLLCAADTLFGSKWQMPAIDTIDRAAHI